MPILVAIDGSWQTDAALRLGALMAQRIGKPLTVLTVVRPSAARAPVPHDEIVGRAREVDLPGTLTPVSYTHLRAHET